MDPDEDEPGQRETLNCGETSRLSKLLEFTINVQLALIIFLAVLWLYDQVWEGLYYFLRFR